MSNRFKDDAKVAGYGYGWLFIGVLAVAALVAGIWGIGYGFSWWSAPWQGKLQARQTIQSGNYRIAAYDHFFNLCASVQTKEATIKALRAELATKPSAQRRDVIEASITANVAGRADDINQYNVDAEKSYTLGQFRASGLPYRLDSNDKETTCAIG